MLKDKFQMAISGFSPRIFGAITPNLLLKIAGCLSEHLKICKVSKLLHKLCTVHAPFNVQDMTLWFLERHVTGDYA